MGEKGIDKFNGHGFHAWQAKTKGYLMRKQLWSIIKPINDDDRVETRQSLAQFATKDEHALAILLTSLDDNFVHYLDDCMAAHEAWTTLEQHFGAIAKHSNVALKMQLYGKLIEPGEDMSSLVSRLKSICSQLTYIKCPIDNEYQIVVLLKVVPDADVGQIVTMLKEKDPIPKIEDVINSLQEHEKKLKGSQQQAIGAYVVSSNRYNHNHKRNLNCTHCGRTNHLSKADCYEINPCRICGKNNHATKYCRL
ncbi:hypothetical protein GOP47_0004694, partial [Adiantum capillus-veneris]